MIEKSSSSESNQIVECARGVGGEAGQISEHSRFHVGGIEETVAAARKRKKQNTTPRILVSRLCHKGKERKLHANPAAANPQVMP